MLNVKFFPLDIMLNKSKTNKQTNKQTKTNKKQNKMKQANRKKQKAKEFNTYCSCDVRVVCLVSQAHVAWQHELSLSTHVHCNPSQVTWLLFGQTNSHAWAVCDQRFLPRYHGVKHCVGDFIHEMKDFKSDLLE